MVTFQGGTDAPNNISIPFQLKDDEVALEAVETYTVSFEILTSQSIVGKGMLEETRVNVNDPDGTSVGISVLPYRGKISWGKISWISWF